MHLPQLSLPAALDTSTADLTADFYKPALSVAVQYDRGVGFFSSGWLRLVAQGMSQFAANNGRARIITSPILTEADWEAFIAGEEARRNPILRAALLTNIAELEKSLETDTLSALAWMVADQVLDIKLAVPHNKLSGDFHDKFGIFTDAEGNQISFNGSPNESIRGTENYESIKIFKSWEPGFAPLVELDVQRFERLWHNEDANVRVYELPEAAREQILKLRVGERPYPEPDWIQSSRLREEREKYRIRLSLPDYVELRKYQSKAIEAWLANNRRGILDMATGTGKTMVALSAITRCEDAGFIVVGAPTRDLVTQWVKELQQLDGIRPIIEISSNNSNWPEITLPRLRLAASKQTRRPFIFVGTYQSLSGSRFLSILNKIAPQDDLGLLIADEVHNVGAPSFQRFLSKHFSFRLGLTATLERAFDTEGTQAVLDYFKGVVYEMSLADAIGSVLCNYKYHLYYSPLDEDEFEEYQKLSQKIGWLTSKTNDQEKDREDIKGLLYKRAKIIKLARNKLNDLRELVSEIPIARCLIYCADLEQVDAVQEILSQKRISHLPFTSRQDSIQRQIALQQLARDDIQAIVAIDCLDEGIDVPQVHQAILLASSTSKRQFIQRRGRILRMAKGKRFAHLVDLFTVPPRRFHENPPTLLFNELRRSQVLAALADNKYEVELTLYNELRSFGIPIEEIVSNDETSHRI